MSSSGVRSTRTISAASCKTRSGTVSRTATPVIRETTSARLSRCWMLSAVHTLTPASSSSWTSCQRFGCRLSGALVWASSSTTINFGLRESAASMSNSSIVRPWYSTLRRGRTSSPWTSALVSARPCSLHEPDDDIDAFVLQAPRVLQHGVGLADARRGAEKTFSRPAVSRRNAARSASGSGRPAWGRLVGAIGARWSS